MLRKYNRKFIHNMPRIAFPAKSPTVRVESVKRVESPIVEEVVKPVEKTKKVKTPKQEVVQPVVNKVEEITEIKND